jgi:hypothetical protein
MNSNGKCTTSSKESKGKKGEFEERAALKWRKPIYVSACKLYIGESPPWVRVGLGIPHAQDFVSLTALSYSKEYVRLKINLNSS